ncbi:TPA: cell division protein FtsZ, partial [Candidatus Bipolaricaulota bacterium]|nr:cell division protein FtsZ [Candidatus Bipolaricaulota bacterium]
VIFNVTGGESLTLDEVTEAATVIRDTVSDQADIFFGAVIQDGFEKVKLTVIATGFVHAEEREAESEEEVILMERLRREERDDLEIPAFLRRRRGSRTLEEED